jgi:hypothetical protein
MAFGYTKAASKLFANTNRNPKYRPVNMHSGDTAYFTVDSLSAFWPGLQGKSKFPSLSTNSNIFRVLAGDVQNAIKLHMICGQPIIGVALQLMP